MQKINPERSSVSAAGVSGAVHSSEASQIAIPVSFPCDSSAEASRSLAGRVELLRTPPSSPRLALSPPQSTGGNHDGFEEKENNPLPRQRVSNFEKRPKFLPFALPPKEEMVFSLNRGSIAPQGSQRISSPAIPPPINFKNAFSDLFKAIMRKKDQDSMMKKEIKDWKFECPKLNGGKIDSKILMFYQNRIKCLPEEYQFEFVGDLEGILEADMHLKMFAESQHAAFIIAKRLAENPEWREIINGQVHGFITLSQVLQAHPKLQKSIQSVSLFGDFLFYPCIICREMFPNLKSIQINSVNKFFYFCDPFDSFPLLEELDLSGNRFYAVPDMPVSQTLRVINLQNNQIQFFESRRLPINILSLNISNNPIKKSVMGSDFFRFRLLREIVLRELGMDELPDFSKNESLMSIDVSGNKIKEINFNHLPISLNFLDVSGNKEMEFKTPKDWKGSIRSLNLSSLGLHVFPDLSQFPDLENLSLCDNSLEDFFIENLKKLKRLDLSKNKFLFSAKKESLCPAFRHLKNLEELNLSETGLCDVPDLSDNANLRFVDLRGNKIIFFDFSSFPISLCFLDVGLNPFKNVSFSLFYSYSDPLGISGRELKIKKYEKLKVIKFDQNESSLSSEPNQMNDKNYDSFFGNLDSFSNLEELDLSGMRLGSDFLNKINFPFKASLEKLNLSGNKLTSCPDLSSFPKLKKVNLSLNFIKEINASCLPRSVLDLNLSMNVLKIEKLSGNLEQLTALERLDLSASHLSEIPNLSLCRNLTCLVLSRNLIKWIDFNKLPPNLDVLDMSGNFLGPENPKISKNWDGQISVPRVFRYLQILYHETGVSSFVITEENALF